MTPAEEYDSILKCLWFHICRGEYDMAVPYLKRLSEMANTYGLREAGFRQIATMLKEIINNYD